MRMRRQQTLLVASQNWELWPETMCAVAAVDAAGVVAAAVVAADAAAAAWGAKEMPVCHLAACIGISWRVCAYCWTE